MPNILLVALELVREARHRRWLLAIAVVLTLLGALLALALRLDVAGGMLQGASFFGTYLASGFSADVNTLVTPLLQVVCGLVYLCGVPIGALLCADFAPDLLAPGRVEHMLSLPVRRAELIAGTYLGVMLIALLGSTYAACVFTLLIGVKTGVWSLAIFANAASATLAWAAVYGAMLASAVIVRSSALSAGVGLALFGAGMGLTVPSVAGYFDVGLERTLVLAVLAPIPRFWMLGRVGSAVMGYHALDADLVRTMIGTLVFGIACVMVAIWEFERRDY